MQSWNDQQAEKLREHFPAWDTWYVPRYAASATWHARPKGHAVALVDADSPDELARKILAMT